MAHEPSSTGAAALGRDPQVKLPGGARTSMWGMLDVHGG
jgi:hypothetical protein